MSQVGQIPVVWYLYIIGLEVSILGHLFRSMPLVVTGSGLLLLWIHAMRKVP